MVHLDDKHTAPSAWARASRPLPASPSRQSVYSAHVGHYAELGIMADMGGLRRPAADPEGQTWKPLIFTPRMICSRNTRKATKTGTACRTARAITPL